ncbi:Putative ribosomal N-acetyltransferase YdaF [Pedobacter sp. Bi27]|uniref:GNAT family N-acetyltransferase n=1 Tax=unclassified Pedobacter TaxID=2628915 RepID=UPI001D39782F|nr:MULTISPECIES: GNAT family N-acetyltransferase [unclassified Pedobacter]CAH0244435.1 Putative ribosomal N-acetyltransferase YdaF [Pedobacter sp. Bi27]CAH0281549.1 Putative ribosomal N-acetyltransferase YdaF [Pedobacter sp. Bi126]CAH0308042.1 Putative ribosomal N-acetyltransferase YdaF [Pedobacter sp. Bi36]
MQLILRTYQPSDVESLVKHANNFNISKYLTNKFPFPYEKKDGEAFIRLALSHEPLQIKAIVLDGEVIGSIGVHQLADIYSKSAEMGYWIAEDYWGKGIVPLAIQEMLNYGFETFDIERIFARTTHTNLASQQVLKKSGFVFEASLKDTIFKNGEYFDELIFGFRKRQLSKEQN